MTEEPAHVLAFERRKQKDEKEDVTYSIGLVSRGSATSYMRRFVVVRCYPEGLDEVYHGRSLRGAARAIARNIEDLKVGDYGVVPFDKIIEDMIVDVSGSTETGRIDSFSYLSPRMQHRLHVLLDKELRKQRKGSIRGALEHYFLRAKDALRLDETPEDEE